nr:hypothetical protein [Allomuricauda sp.]
MKPIVLILFLSTTCLAFGQVLDTNDASVRAALGNAQVEGSPLANYFQRRTPAMDQLMRDVKNNGTTQSFYIGAQEGSAYENEKFTNGKVYSKDELLDDVYFRYNAFSDELEVKKTRLEEEDYQALIKSNDIYIISNSGKKYIYNQFFDKKGEVQNGYLILLSAGEKASLYKQYDVKFFEGKEAENSMVNPIPSRFTPFIGYYVQMEGSDKIVKLPTKKNKLFKFLEDNIAGFDAKSFRKKDIDLDTDQGLLILFNNLY